MNKNSIISLIFLNTMLHGAVDFDTTLKTGPGWDFGYTRLVPNRTSTFFLESANDQTAWNLFSCLEAEGTIGVGDCFKGSLGIGGEWLRNGDAIVTDANRYFFGTRSLDNNVVVFSNALSVRAKIDFCVPRFEACDIQFGAGYFFQKKFESWTFINQPILFFLPSYYQGFFLDFNAQKKFDSVSLKINYNIIFGHIRTRLSQRGVDLVVMRKIPQVINNSFSVGLIYHFSDDIALEETLIYNNAHNHKRGDSTSYIAGVRGATLCNVDSIELKNIQFLIALSYDF